MSFLTTQQAADRLGMKRQTLEGWRFQGQGPKFRRFGRSIRYAVHDLDEWADKQTVNFGTDADSGKGN